MSIKKILWGKYHQQEIFLISMSNGQMDLSLTNFGCTIVSVLVPDKQGMKKNVVLGYDDLTAYLNDPFYVGCVIGRFASRISKAHFVIEGKEYALARNEADTDNHLHGGTNGFNKKIFKIIKETAEENGSSVQLYYRSDDMEEGYPGNLDVYITFSLTVHNEIVIDYRATTDKPTHVNLTNHSYFNLSSAPLPAITQELCIDADHFLVTGEGYIPTGEIRPVEGSPYDFRKRRRIDKFRDSLSYQGYNDYFVLNEKKQEEVKVELYDRASGRRMRIKTSFPGIQLYTGDYLSGSFIKNQGICLETQLFPDSPNQDAFPPTLLYPHQTFLHQTVFQFDCPSAALYPDK